MLRMLSVFLAILMLGNACNQQSANVANATEIARAVKATVDAHATSWARSQSDPVQIPRPSAAEALPSGVIDRRFSLIHLLPTDCARTNTCRQEAEEIARIVMAAPSAAIYEFDPLCSHGQVFSKRFYLPEEAMTFGGELDWVFSDPYLSNLIITPMGDGSWQVVFEYCGPK